MPLADCFSGLRLQKQRKIVFKCQLKKKKAAGVENDPIKLMLRQRPRVPEEQEKSHFSKKGVWHVVNRITLIILNGFLMPFMDNNKKMEVSLI